MASLTKARMAQRLNQRLRIVLRSTIVIATVVSCSSRPDSSRVPADSGRDHGEDVTGGRAALRQFIDACMAELRARTDAHATDWGLGAFARWDLDLESGALVFSDPERGRAEARAQVVGTFNASDGTWLWAWANPSVPEVLRADSLKVKEYLGQRGFEHLIVGKRNCTESDAWEMTALAVRVAGRQGAYRGPASATLFVFVTFDDVRLTK